MRLRTRRSDSGRAPRDTGARKANAEWPRRSLAPLQLAACRLLERFASHDNATHEHVIHARKEVLRGRSTVDDYPFEGIATRHRDRPMQESVGSHFSAIDATHRLTLDVDDLDEFFDQVLLALRTPGRGRFGFEVRPTRARAVVTTAPTSAFPLGWGWRAMCRQRSSEPHVPDRSCVRAPLLSSELAAQHRRGRTRSLLGIALSGALSD